MNNSSLSSELVIYDQYINKTVWRFARNQLEFRDLKAIAITGFWKAKKVFKTMDQSIKLIDFKSVMITRINAEIIDYLRIIYGRDYNKVKNQVDLELVDNTEMYQLTDNNINLEKVRQTMKQVLTVKELKLINLWLQGYRLREIAELMNYHETRINQIKSKAINKIKKQLKVK